MKKVILVIAIIGSCFTTFAQGHKKIRGYSKSNGTYVQSHHRTNQNSTISDNWSTKPNVNPFTGKVGKKTYSRNSRKRRS